MLLAKKYNTCIHMYTNVRLKEHREVWKALWPHPLLPRENQIHDHGASVLNRAETALRHYHPFLGRIYCQNQFASCRCLFCWFANLALAVKGALSDMLFPWGHYLQSWGNHLLNMQTCKWFARAQKHLEVWCTNNFHPFSQELRGCCASLPRTLW